MKKFCINGRLKRKTPEIFCLGKRTWDFAGRHYKRGTTERSPDRGEFSTWRREKMQSWVGKKREMSPDKGGASVFKGKRYVKGLLGRVKSKGNGRKKVIQKEDETRVRPSIRPCGAEKIASSPPAGDGRKGDVSEESWAEGEANKNESIQTSGNLGQAWGFL